METETPPSDIPSGQKEKVVEAFVLLDRQYELTRHLIQTSGTALDKFENAMGENRQDLTNVLSVFNYVFALIDHLVRYQKIVFSFPVISQKSAECRALNTTMGELKDARNQLQHINMDIENENSGPLLGAVGWAKGNTQYMAALTDVSRKRSSPGLIFDTHEGKHTSEFCYIYGEVYHDLGKAVEGMHKFQEFLRKKVSVTVDGKDYNPAKHFIALKMQINLLEN
ncbi:hypothetical protein [Nitratireductor sp. XY-223]|uniref:hypothetical protein n=1 Tax=Nitratireductor sp. XY-223 TaxID=2561926 RepID=UPI0010AABB4B|nr:hypothetical protein [Nitratireductor sp. XY-223]